MAFTYRQGDRPLEGFTIQRGVGRGGFGEVYHAVSDGGKEVALKFLRENPQVELRGVAHCLNLKSPYLVTLYDVKQNADGEWFVIMEYVAGPCLRELMIDAPEGLGVQKAAYFLKEIGKGLAYLHDRGIVHRDLKPGNIFYEDGYVKIGDYGLSKAMSPSAHSGQTMSVGTVHYMAPEVGSGNYSKAIDIYAAGVMLYEMLLGRLPFQGASMGEVLMKHLTAQPEVDELPAPFPDVIRTALAKDPNDRYDSMQAMVQAVFAESDLERSVAAFEPNSLSTAAHRVAVPVGVHAAETVAAGGGGAGPHWGSSQAPGIDAQAPPVIGSAKEKSGGRLGSRIFNEKLRKELAPWSDGPEGAPFPQRYRRKAGLLGLFLGMFGVHRFYLGYNSIGIYQILATFFSAGIGGLWGMIEGVMILCHTHFPDALGRPLLGRDPRQRSSVARLVFGVVAVVSLLAGLGLLIPATFAGEVYDLESITLSRALTGVTESTYYINTFHMMYFGTSVLLPLSFFAIWKAYHRKDLRAWRSTIRPGLMCLMLALIGAGLTFELCIAAGQLQLVGLFVAAGAGFVFTALWMFRGPPGRIEPDDAYWHLAWATVFRFLLVGAVIGFFATINAIEETPGKFKFERSGPAFHTADYTVTHTNRRTGGRIERTPEVRTYTFANPMYNHLPLAAMFLACLAVGSISEVRSRKRQARRAEAFIDNDMESDG